jgi:hypothetical protein
MLAGQTPGLKEVDDDIWLVGFMDPDLGYIQPRDNPFGPKVVTHVSGTILECTP